jgi:hypothetical protein
MLENDLVSFPALDNKTFRVEWQAFDPRQEKHLSFEDAADYSRLSLEIRPDEYVFYGYDYFINDIVWSVRVDETDVFPEKTDFYGVWVNDLDVKHILGANEWTFLSPNGNTYTMSDLAWTKKINYGPTASDYPKGYEITGTIVSIAYNGPTYLSVGNTSTACYCLHKTDKTKIAADNNPDYAAFFNKGSP